MDEKNNEQLEEDIFPDALRNLQSKQYGVAALLVAFSIALAIATKSWNWLLLVIVSALIALNALSIKHEYKRGNIEEKILTCTSVKKIPGKEMANVTFTSDLDGEQVKSYKFVVSGKSQISDFDVDSIYAVYFVKGSRNLLTYIAL